MRGRTGDAGCCASRTSIGRVRSRARPARIVETLQAFGFEWDGEVVRQHDRAEYYAGALQALRSRGLTFECSCSRIQLEEDSRYPGTCRVCPSTFGVPTATRLRVEPGSIRFSDRIQGIYRQDVGAAVGDFILKRRDAVVAYQLAVVVDDAAQGITHVVRGADLLDNTPRQIYLQQRLDLPTPTYAHVPVLTEADDTKLAKSRRSLRLDPGAALPQLMGVFRLLGLVPPASLLGAGLKQAWGWAIGQWDVRRVPKRLNVRLSS